MTIRHAEGSFEDRGDIDWFRVNLVAGATYEVKGSAAGAFVFQIIGPDGQPLQFPIGFGNYANFVAPVSGSYYIAMTSLDATGAYSVSVEDVVDPIPASTATPRSIVVGETLTITGNNNAVSHNDDWFAIDVVAGQSYVLATDQNIGDVYIVDVNGSLVAMERPGDGGQQVHFTAPKTGRYYAGAKHFGGNEYRLTFLSTADDHADTPGGAGAFSVGTPVNGIWETAGDDDAYAITLSAGSSYNFTLQAVDQFASAYIEVLDQSGALIWTSGNQAIPRTTVFSPEAGGTYYVSAALRDIPSGDPASQAYLDDRPYTLSATALAGDLTDNVLTTGTVSVGGQSAGAWEAAGDGDWFRIELQQGQSYTFSLATSSFQGVKLGLFDAQGNLVVQSAGVTPSGTALHHTIAATGIYFLGAVAGHPTDSYTVSVAMVADDFANNISTTGQVVNGAASGVAEVSGDSDWFAVQLTGGLTYSLGNNFSPIFLVIRDARGVQLSNLTGFGDFRFTAPVSGLYYVEASANAGAYSFTLPVVTDDFLESAATTGVFRLTIEGTAGADTLVGTADDERFVALGGDDLFIVGEGSDRYDGGAGTDTLSYVNSSFGVNIDMSQGRSFIGGVQDDVITGVENVLGSSFDDMVTGSTIANTLKGEGGNDILRGFFGNDTLYGGEGNDFLVGGFGADIMAGGTGDDTYYFDQTSDSLSEFAGEGFDRLATTVTLALAADADIERLDVEELVSTNAIDLTGSAIANVIYGNNGQNVLRGEAGNDELQGFGGNDFLVGGAGADIMAGGLGDDTFYVDDASDIIGEVAGEGNDRIAASVSFVLSNGANVEVLEAVNLLATTAFDLTGSDSANTITGNNGVNILRGEGGNDILSSAGGDDFLVGGTGVDNMTGGAGNDTYFVDSASDVVNEIAGEGTNDRVSTAVSYALSAGADVERLEAANSGDTSAINLTGSASSNAISGNAGVNTLNGGVGGNDVLAGLGGADIFQFTSTLDTSNADVIVDFLSGTDQIALDDAVFATLAPGPLNASAFVTGSAATTAAHRIVYNNATGALFYDADGDGAGAAVQFATLQGAPSLAASDIAVI